MTCSIRNFEKLNFTPKSSVFCSSQGQTSKYDRLAHRELPRIALDHSNYVVHISQKKTLTPFTVRSASCCFLQVMQNQSISALSAYSDSDMLPHPKWYQFKQASHSTPFVRYVTFFCHLGYTSLLPSFSTVNFGSSFFNAGSYSLSHKLANTTAREAPIAKPKPSFCTYHKPLHLKCISLTAKFSSFFIVLRHVSGGLTCSCNLLRAISTTSLSETLVYKLFTSREIILSSVPTQISPRSPWPFECSFLYLPPQSHQSTLPMFYLGCHMSYQVKKRRDEVMCLVCVLLLIHTV